MMANINTMMTLSDVVFRGLKLISRNMDKYRMYTKKYYFDNRMKKRENLLIIVAGYQDYLWDIVFKRIKKFTNNDIDICVVVPGKNIAELSEICKKNDWSYLSIRENKLALAQNMAIKLHTSAKWIYKLDEDIFIGDSYFEELKNTYIKAEKDGIYRVGVVSPTLNVNGACYRSVLEKMGKMDAYKAEFSSARVTCDDDPIYLDGRAACFMWNITLPIDKTIDLFLRENEGYWPVPIRLSIGAFLIKREVWEKMKGFRVAASGQLAWEEICLCDFCVNKSYTVLVSNKVFAGHFGFGRQKETVKKLFEERIGDFMC